MHRRGVLAISIGVALLMLVGVALFRTPFESQPPLHCTQWIKVRCHHVSGRVLYVDRSDSDGDGDVHLFLSSRASVPGPGMSVAKTPREARPASIPGFGDWVEALGYVYRGDHGERLLDGVRVDR